MYWFNDLLNHLNKWVRKDLYKNTFKFQENKDIELSFTAILIPKLVIHQNLKIKVF